MKLLSTLSAFLFSFEVFALGPIPNGVYNGPMTCSAPHVKFTVENTLTIGDTTMLWASKNGASKAAADLATFTIDSDGYFTVAGNTGEKGAGYFTKYGFHKDAVLKNGTPGEDTFLFLANKLYLVSSATVQGVKYKCEAVFAGAKH